MNDIPYKTLKPLWDKGYNLKAYYPQGTMGFAILDRLNRPVYTTQLTKPGYISSDDYFKILDICSEDPEKAYEKTQKQS